MAKKQEVNKFPKAEWYDNGWHFHDYWLPCGPKVPAPEDLDLSRLPRPEYLPGERVRFDFGSYGRKHIMTGVVQKAELTPDYERRTIRDTLEDRYYTANVEYEIHTPHARSVPSNKVLGRV
jgi:hypothetical protein